MSAVFVRLQHRPHEGYGPVRAGEAAAGCDRKALQPLCRHQQTEDKFQCSSRGGNSRAVVLQRDQTQSNFDFSAHCTSCSGAGASVLLRPEQEPGWRARQEETIRGWRAGPTAASRWRRASPGAAQTAPQAPWVTWHVWPVCLDSVANLTFDLNVDLFHVLLCAQLNRLVPAGSVWPALRWRNTSSSASGHTWVSKCASRHSHALPGRLKALAAVCSVTWRWRRAAWLLATCWSCPSATTSLWWIWAQRWCRRWRSTSRPWRASTRAEESAASCLRGITEASTCSSR